MILAFIVMDTLAGVGLLLSSRRQTRNREAVATVGGTLLACAALLAVITR